MAGEVDHFFHFAATMNWVAPFNQDTVANIDALKSAVAFCQHTRLTKLHYASSMGIWTLLSHAPGPILEDNIHDQGGELPGGYFQSKWVNELILHKAMSAGLPVNIYRIGDVKGNSESGLGDPHNFGNLVMQYFIKNSIVIDNSTPEFNFIPVDYLTRAIAHIATRETGKTFQFTNPDLISFRDIYTAAENVGHKCRLVTHSEWLDELSADSDQLARVLKPIFREFQPGFNHSPKSFYQIGVEMFKKPHDTTNTCTALQHTSLRCPGMLQDQVLERYLVHLGETAQL